MQIQVMNFNNREHFEFINYLINYNAKEFLNDDMTGQMMIDLLSQPNRPVFIGYLNNKPYGVIYVELSMRKIATIHACCGKERNFFTNIKVMRAFIKYLFETVKVNKIKIDVLVYDTNAEFVARCVGFRKEGVLREEVMKNGKAQNMILLSLTKSDYLNNKHILKRKDFKEIGELVYGKR